MRVELGAASSPLRAGSHRPGRRQCRHPTDRRGDTNPEVGCCLPTRRGSGCVPDALCVTHIDEARDVRCKTFGRGAWAPRCRSSW